MVKEWLDQLKEKIEAEISSNQLVLPKISKTSDLNCQNSLIEDKAIERKNSLLELEINKKPMNPIQDYFNDDDMILPRIYDNGIYQIIEGNSNSISDISKLSKA